jgi:hypothetical protein
MSKQVAPGAVAAVLAVVVVLLGFWAWRSFGASKTPGATQEQRLMQEEEALRSRAPVGYVPGR